MRAPLTIRTAALGAAILSTAALAANVGTNLEPVPEPLAKGFASINEADARAWLKVLAGPEMEGRGTGQPGFQRAADWMAARFKEIGLKPIGENGTYFQPVPFFRTSVDAEGSSLTGPNGFKLTVGKDLGFARTSGGAVTAEVVFVSAYGQEARVPENAELEGKIVVLRAINTGAAFRRSLSARRPLTTITVADQVPAQESWVRRRRANETAAASTGGTPRATISLEAAKRLAQTMRIDVNAVDLRDPGAGMGYTANTTGQQVTLTLAVKQEAITVPNVVGLWEGSDPALKHEHIGVGAHLDHLGIQGGVVFPGADDDGSGNTALLLVARALKENPVKPKRSVLFMAFTGEEMGLIGSSYYVENPILPLKDMVCLLQMDMVGRNEEKEGDKPEDNVRTIHLVGSKRISTDLHEATIRANRHVGFEFEYDQEDVYTRSDHAVFAARGVPITFLFSGFHPDYHQPTDTIEKINYAKIVDAARLNYLVLMDAANRAERFRKDVLEKAGGSSQ